MLLSQNSNEWWKIAIIIFNRFSKLDIFLKYIKSCDIAFQHSLKQEKY